MKILDLLLVQVFTGVGKDSDALNAYKLETLSDGWKKYLNVEGVSEKDLFLFHYDVNKLINQKTKGIWLQYYSKRMVIPWKCKLFIKIWF